MPVTEQQARPDLQLHQGIQRGRGFPKRKQAGHVGKGGRPAVDDVFDKLQIRVAKHNNGGAGDGVLLQEADIHASYVAHLPDLIVTDDAWTQPLLDSDGFLWRYVPRVEKLVFKHLIANTILGKFWAVKRNSKYVSCCRYLGR